MDKSFIFMYFTILAATLYFLIVPKEHYKRTLIYGIIFGGIANFMIVVLLSYLNLIRYKNLGFFDIGGFISSWTPVTWSFIFALFFYLLPVRLPFMIPYILAFAAFTYGSGLVFENFGVFEYLGFWRYAAPVLFTVWYSASAWVYLKNSELQVK